MNSLKSYAEIISKKISVSVLNEDTYIGVDNLLPNKGGKTVADYIPSSGNATEFKEGDILIGNIRPYFKKIWYATHSGGASSDVIVLRAKDSTKSKFLYAVLSQDSFFKYDMLGSKGSKMPRGDKNHIMNYGIKTVSNSISIGELLYKINSKIAINNKISENLQQQAKLLYDYWFNQFEFPNEEGKPYKSSGGKMVWNEELKREIPEGWETGNLYDIAEFINGLACQKYRPVNDDKDKLKVIKITEMHDGFTNNTEFVRADVPKKYVIKDGDILFSWSASLEVQIWNGGKGCLNQHIFKVVPTKYSSEYTYTQLSAYVINFVKLAEARKTTMGHITTDHLKQSKIVLPPINIVNMFSSSVEKTFKNTTSNCEENRRLTQLRDWLLPMLMNGQATILD